MSNLNRKCIKGGSSSYQYYQETADLVTFTVEILNEKLHFLCSKSYFKVEER